MKSAPTAGGRCRVARTFTTSSGRSKLRAVMASCDLRHRGAAVAGHVKRQPPCGIPDVLGGHRVGCHLDECSTFVAPSSSPSRWAYTIVSVAVAASTPDRRASTAAARLPAAFSAIDVTMAATPAAHGTCSRASRRAICRASVIRFGRSSGVGLDRRDRRAMLRQTLTRRLAVSSSPPTTISPARSTPIASPTARCPRVPLRV